MNDLVGGRLELLLLLLAAHLLLREWRLLVLLVLVCVAGVSALVGVALVRRLKRYLCDASLETEESKVCAARPRED